MLQVATGTKSAINDQRSIVFFVAAAVGTLLQVGAQPRALATLLAASFAEMTAVEVARLPDIGQPLRSALLLAKTITHDPSGQDNGLPLLSIMLCDPSHSIWGESYTEVTGPSHSKLWLRALSVADSMPGMRTLSSSIADPSLLYQLCTCYAEFVVGVWEGCLTRPGFDNGSADHRWMRSLVLMASLRSHVFAAPMYLKRDGVVKELSSSGILRDVPLLSMLPLLLDSADDSVEQLSTRQEIYVELLRRLRGVTAETLPIIVR
jgi:hypothetical protein